MTKHPPFTFEPPSRTGHRFGGATALAALVLAIAAGILGLNVTLLGGVGAVLTGLVAMFGAHDRWSIERSA